jgi:hypothetical protein
MSNIVFARTKVRRVLQTTLAVALVGGVVSTTGSPAVAAPEKVLQSVAITLGSDSSIQAIASTAVRAGEGESLSTDSETLDPAEVSGELPVRVLTSYRLGDRTGTDLSEIEGEAGRVVVDVTVQNVTARPEQLTYDFNGSQQRQNALVATPMTVVASADLGEDSLGSVVTTDDVSPDDVTNGVLGRGAGQSADVQWAALLAPPRLGSSATFRLVQDTEDFRVPTFDLSVQPGLVTDPSVQQLLEAAFSEDPSSTLRLETSTIELVSNVNATLTIASSVLAQIQRELGASAEQLGQKTIADLESSAALVSSSLSGLAGDIDSLSSQMSSEMERASAETVAQFQETVGSMQELLGDPRSFDDLPTVESIECGGDLPRLRVNSSITEQMIAITSQLRTIKSATDDCKQTIKDGLNAAIGTPDDAAGAPTVIGSIRGTQEQIQTQIEGLLLAGNKLADDFDGDLLGYLTTSVGTLGGLVESIQTLAGDLNGSGGVSLKKQLEGMQTVLGSMQVQLGPDTGLAATVSEIQTAAGDAADSNGALAVQVEQAATAICDLQPTDATDPTFAEYDAISALLVGEDCAGAEAAPADGVPASANAATTGTALEAITTAAASAADQVASFRGQVDELSGTVDKLLESDENRKGKVDELIAAIESLSDGRKPDFEIGPDDPAWPNLGFKADQGGAEPHQACAAVQAFDTSQIPEDPIVAPDPLELLQLFHKKMECNQFGIEDEIRGAFEAGAGLLATTQAELEEHVTDIDDARGKANEDVDGLVDTLTGALDVSVESIRTEGKRAVTRQREQLAAEERQLSASLDQRITDAVRRIEGTVSDSNRNLIASEKALLADLDEVLLDLGTREEDGTGLLGALVKGAADTGTATDNVVRANRSTAEFAGVRSTALEDVFLQQEQLSRSLTLLESYPAFGMELPAGSSHLTVFTFQIGER